MQTLYVRRASRLCVSICVGGGVSDVRPPPHQLQKLLTGEDGAKV